MRLAHKVKKLGSRRMWRRTGNRFARVVRGRRFPQRLTADKIIATINLARFREIEARYGVADPGEAPEKYLQLRRWIDVNIGRVRDHELDFGAQKRVLDIGCGAGYFLYICRWLGHDILGLDIDENPMFRELTELLDVPRVIWRIERHVPLPDLGAKFDVISAHMICFNELQTERVWGPAEWEFFLKDARSRLNPGGRVHLAFNRELDGSFFPQSVHDYFVRCGAEMDGHRITFRSASLARV